MSQPEDANEVETCQMAMEAALEKGIGFCNTQESRIEVLAQTVGLEGSSIDFDIDARLDSGPGESATDVETRQWVLARAEKDIAEETVDQPLDAINAAWRKASERMSGGEEEAEDVDTDDE